MNAGIAGVIREKAGHDVDLPEDERRWNRFPCPFCGKPRAAISYEIGLFICHHADCGMKLWRDLPAVGYHTIARFRLQIEQAARNIKSNWGKWLSEHDVIQQARLFVIEYDDDGLIDDWEADLDGDQNQVDRFLLRELNCDLGNWARKIVRRKRNENALVEAGRIKAAECGRTRKGDEDSAAGNEWRNAAQTDRESVENIVMWQDWPTLGLKLIYGLTNEEIAGIAGVSERTVNRWAADELEDAKKAYQRRSLTPVNFSTCDDRKISKKSRICVALRPSRWEVCIEVTPV